MSIYKNLSHLIRIILPPFQPTQKQQDPSPWAHSLGLALIASLALGLISTKWNSAL